MKKIICSLISILFAAGYLSAANIDVTPEDFGTKWSEAADGDVLLLASGEYTTSFALQDNKVITLKAAEGAQVTLKANPSCTETTVNTGLIVDGISITTSNNHYIQFTAGEVKTLEFRNCNIYGVNRCFFYPDGGDTIDKIVFDNCIIHDLGNGGWNFIWSKATINHLELTNSTLYNYSAGESFFSQNGQRLNDFTFICENNTVYNWGKGDGDSFPFVDASDKFSENSSYTFRNNIFYESGVSASAPNLIRVSKGTVVAEKNLVVGFGTFNTSGTATKTEDNYTLDDLGLSYVAFSDPDNGDFSIKASSPLASAGKDGKCLGDPRWIEAAAAVYDNEPTTIKWAMNSITPEEDVACTPEGVMMNMEFNYNIPLHSKATTFGSDFVLFQPTVKQNNAVATDMLSYKVTPAFGYTFKPTNISFKSVRYGTGGGFIDIVAKGADGTEITLLTGFNPNRNNDASEQPSIISQAISGIESSGESFEVQIYLYSLDNNKQVGFGDVVIEGLVSGEKAALPIYSLTTKSNIADAGVISTSPRGDAFDEGTKVNVSVEPNFGFRFINWTDGEGNTISTEKSFAHIMSANIELTANFQAVNTYALNLSIEGGAKDYMVQLSPEGTMIDGKRMYEEGTAVTLTASGNSILTFLTWEDYTTVSERVITVSSDLNITANYEAAEYIVAWDFYKVGGSNRVADFASTDDNQYTTLILTTLEGNTNTWLDKSVESNGAYDGIGGGLIWKDIPEELYHFQTKVNASDFKDIKISSKVRTENYQAYYTHLLQWSVDGTTWTTAASIDFTSTKTWFDLNASLPEAANNASELYIRWIADRESNLISSTENRDGTGVGAIYITGTKQVYCDGVVPVLVSTVPTNGATGISASGRIILTFDEKIKVGDDVSITLNGKTLYPTVTNTSLVFNYSGLEYNKAYTIALAGNSVADLCEVYNTETISISFTTMERPNVTPTPFGYVVRANDADDLKAALAAANAATGSNRYRIFVPAGEYNLGNVYGTAITRSKVSLIGEDMDRTIIRNNPPGAGIGVSATIFINGASDTYIQDITLKNDWDYFGNSGGVAVCLQDKGNKTILKDVKMLSYQDTYFSDNASMRSYVEDCEIHGTVDFICGGGDVFFNRLLIYLEERGGNCITAPRGTTTWGYVFSDCTIDGASINNGGYALGRPWNEEPKAVYLNTTMNIIPSAAGWTNMGPLPKLFAEYNSRTAAGTLVDVSQRKTSYSVGGVDTPYTGPTVLTETQAAQYTIQNVLSGTDGWMPELATEQNNAPVVTFSSNTLSWGGDIYALCYIVTKDGAFYQQITSNSLAIAEGGKYVVYAANEMGGLSSASNEIDTEGSSIVVVTPEDESKPVNVYSIDGIMILQNVTVEEAVQKLPRGLYIVGKKKLFISK